MSTLTSHPNTAVSGTPDQSAPAETQLRLGKWQLEAPTALAPMAALTDSVFRRMIKRQGGCGLQITEMVSANALLQRVPSSLALLKYTEEERPIGGQLMGASPQRMAEAAQVIEDMGFDFVDINMGCPARKVVSGGGGSALMRDLKNTERILTAIQSVLSIPLTVKIRAGWSDDCLNAPDVARLAENCGASLVSVHARTKRDAFGGSVREEILEETRKAVRIPVFANGDIRTPVDALKTLEATGCSGVMLGRGAIANPWVLQRIAERENDGPTLTQSRRWILDHFAILSEELDGKRLLGKLRAFSGWYTRGLLRGSSLRQRINQLQTAEAFVHEIEAFFSADIMQTEQRTDYEASHQQLRP